ncbi:hypothetical protein Tco_0802653 [Tanacetum coccineum]|uniref:Reverse transcriptase domain-containing protein n=1 Tax=Tanacetum coccineum TaxID=301880 RepID=A0ABQ4ZZD5_9ASTR
MMASFFQTNTASTSGLGSLPSNTIANLKGELKAITTRSGLVLDEPSVPMPPPFINPKEDKRVEETLTDPEHDNLEYGDNDTSSLFNPTSREINPIMIDVYNVSHEEILKDLFATNHPSGNPTSSLTSHTDLTSPEVNDDIFTPEGDIIENLLNFDKTKDLPPYHDNPSSGNPTLISKPMTKSSSSPTLTSIKESDLIWEEFKAYLAKKIKDSKILIDELDPPGSSDFLPSPEYDLVFYEYFFEVDALSSTNNEDKVFNPGILIHKSHFEVTNCATPEKNVKKPTNASLILKDFNPPLYELPFHKEVLRLSFTLVFIRK